MRNKSTWDTKVHETQTYMRYKSTLDTKVREI